MKNNEKLIPKIGAYVLETLTTGMYTNPLDSLREYVQNSFDSINEAESRGVLSEGAGRIEIIIDTESRVLRIRDNGMGIPASEVIDRLINIGMSSKSIDKDAGFRGIGRLAGIAYCEKLVFRTQAPGEMKISCVYFDSKRLCKTMSPEMRQVEELATVMSQYSEIETQTARHKDHFFEVSMENINEEAELFLNWNKIKIYLSQTAPVGFDAQSFHLTKDILTWTKERNIKLPTVCLLIKAGSFNVEVFKPYQKLTYTTKKENLKVHVKEIKFYPENAGPDSLFWLWYAETNLPGMIADETVSELRLRKNNISIGDGNRVSEIFTDIAKSYNRFNAYFIGEIYVQSSDVIPNAHRDGFEDNKTWLKIREALREFFVVLGKKVQDASKVRNIDLGKIINSVEKELEKVDKRKKTGFANSSEKDALVDSLEKLENKINVAINNDREDSENTKLEKTRELLIFAKNIARNQIPYTTKELNSALDKKQRKIITDIIDILYDVLDEDNFEKARNAIIKKYRYQDGGTKN